MSSTKKRNFTKSSIQEQDEKEHTNIHNLSAKKRKLNLNEKNEDQTCEPDNNHCKWYEEEHENKNKLNDDENKKCKENPTNFFQFDYKFAFANDNGDNNKLGIDTGTPTPAKPNFSEFTGIGFGTLNDGSNTNQNKNKETEKNESIVADWSKVTSKSGDGEYQWNFDWNSTNFDFCWNQSTDKDDKNNDNENNSENSNDESQLLSHDEPKAILKGEALDSGDQRDKILLSIKAKIYKLEKKHEEDDSKEKPNSPAAEPKYSEKGIGMLNVATYKREETDKTNEDSHNNNQHGRIICRRDQTHTLLVNIPILKQTKIQVMNERFVRIASLSVDDKENDKSERKLSGAHLETVLIKPVETADVMKLMEVLQELQQEL